MRTLLAAIVALGLALPTAVVAQEAGGLRRDDAGEWQLQCGTHTTYLNLSYGELNLAVARQLNIVVGTVSRVGSSTPTVGARVIVAPPREWREAQSGAPGCVLVRLGPAK